MIHLLMVLTGLGTAWWLRQGWQMASGHWVDRWQRALVCFLLPPLLLILTAIAVVCMGPHGRMVLLWEGWVCYGLAIGFLVLAAGAGVWLTWQGIRTLRSVRCHRVIQLQGRSAHLLDSPTLYSAQVGFWHPVLLVSQGLLDQLDQNHLEAVLVHEDAHADFHDTFWFFCLGWIRRCTHWLPQTEAIWQELLILRELRADHRAAQQIDPLTLAEALLQVVSAPILQSDISAAFNPVVRDRLTERIDALLADPEPMEMGNPSWLWLLASLTPLLVIPFHH